MLDAYRKFCEDEYKEAKMILDRGGAVYITNKELIDGSLKFCLGVAQFLQTVGYSYKDVDAIYAPYRKKFYDLLDK